MNFYKDKVVVVTGGAGVLGSSMARCFYELEAQVVLIDRNEDALNDLLKELPNAKSFIGDVLNQESITGIKDQVIKEFGRVDVLLNVAGGNVEGATQREDQTVFDIDSGLIDKAIQLNLHGTIYPSLVFGEMIAKNENGGSIINISSMATYSAITRVMGYSIAKSGVNSLTQWMACELARNYGDKVRVNAIAPGFFIGNQNRKLLLNPDGSLTSRSEKVINKTPMGRFGSIDELNGAVKFLCGNEATFITGVVLPIDGGFSAFSGV
ncbi:SDR family oxidoreductase [Marinoscillum pacificum]|uniref:SDR family oxidoreductase n=1 Tax=Marinoscillum pacificum TaxID=392723 RepID=UPI0021587EFB|nr:SDR family oxidoreductase [Marinoscillum pacificum]